MAKYLFRANYTLDGLRGLRREGGTPRKAVIEGSVGGLGGTVECMSELELAIRRAKAPRAVKQRQVGVHVRGLCDACQ